jgi:GNAT superfamily N-acetyltransferase
VGVRHRILEGAIGMRIKNSNNEAIEFFPVSKERWKDMVKLFGDRGACGGCWCMWWRQTRSVFNKNKGNGNKNAMKKIVEKGKVPGILVYIEGIPVGWCAIAPREEFIHLERSRVLKRVDEAAVWSIMCFFVARTYRRKGISVQLIKAAAEYARKQGAAIVEGYPMEPKKGNIPDAFAYSGFASSFRQAGFVEVMRRSPTRPIMRFYLKT